MVTKKIQIEFADPMIKAVDYLQDIREAAEKASLNLYARFDIQLGYPMPDEQCEYVYVEIRIPESMAENFAYGNRLRGISIYLLKKYPEKYEPHVKSRRLLTYFEIEDTSVEVANTENEIDRFEAMIQFAKLLKCTDDRSNQKIERIVEILNEDDKGEKHAGNHYQ